jgi:hypothetical protein
MRALWVAGRAVCWAERGVNGFAYTHRGGAEVEARPSADAGPAEIEVRGRRLVRGLVATGGLGADVSEVSGGRAAGGADPASDSSTSDNRISGLGRFLVVLGVMDVGLGRLLREETP